MNESRRSHAVTERNIKIWRFGEGGGGVDRRGEEEPKNRAVSREILLHVARSGRHTETWSWSSRPGSVEELNRWLLSRVNDCWRPERESGVGDGGRGGRWRTGELNWTMERFLPFFGASLAGR